MRVHFSFRCPVWGRASVIVQKKDKIKICLMSEELHRWCFVELACAHHYECESLTLSAGTRVRVEKHCPPTFSEVEFSVSGKCGTFFTDRSRIRPAV